MKCSNCGKRIYGLAAVHWFEKDYCSVNCAEEISKFYESWRYYSNNKGRLRDKLPKELEVQIFGE